MQSESGFVNPLGSKGFFRDEAVVRSVAESGRKFAIPFAPLLHSNGSARARMLRELRLFFRLCLKLKAQFVFTNALAQSKFDLKSAREAQAIGVLLGLAPRQAKIVSV